MMTASANARPRPAAARSASGAAMSAATIATRSAKGAVGRAGERGAGAGDGTLVALDQHDPRLRAAGGDAHAGDAGAGAEVDQRSARTANR